MTGRRRELDSCYQTRGEESRSVSEAEMLLHAETCPLPCCCSSAWLQSIHSLLLSQTHTYASGKSRMALLVRAFTFVSYFLLEGSLALIREDLRKDKLSLLEGFMSHARAVEATRYQSLGCHPPFLSAQIKTLFLLLCIRDPLP